MAETSAAIGTWLASMLASSASAGGAAAGAGGAVAAGGTAATAGGSVLSSLAAGSALVGAGAGLYTALNQPKAPGAPTQTDYAKEKQQAAQAQAEALLKRRGMASTILTSPLGAGGSSKATLGA